MPKYVVLLTHRREVELGELERELNRHGVIFRREMPEENWLLNEVLFISDMEKVCHSLLEEGVAVLGWLSDENRGADFSGIPYLIENLNEAEYTYLKKVYCRFHSLPWEIGETKRCRIREMIPEDMEALYEIYEGEAMTRFTEGPYEDREREKEYLQSYAQNAYVFWGFGTWLIEDRENGLVIGQAGYNLREGYEDPELGFAIRQECQGKGYAYEVCKAVLEIGKREYGFIRVQALVKQENEASVKLLEKLGFNCIGPVTDREEPYLLYRKRLMN